MLFTLDNHYLKGGQGEMVAAAVAESGLTNRPRVVRFGVKEIPACGTDTEVLAYHKLDADSLAEAVRSTLT